MTAAGEQLPYDVLLVASWARLLRHDAEQTDVSGRALWWPPTKIAGRELAGYRDGLDEEAGRRSGRSINVDVGVAGTGGLEVLGLG